MKNKMIIAIAAVLLAIVSAAVVTVSVSKQLRREAVYEAYANACARGSEDIRDYMETYDEKYYMYLTGEISTLVNLPFIIGDENDPLCDDTLSLYMNKCLENLVNDPETARENIEILRDALDAFAAQGNSPSANHQGKLLMFNNRFAEG